MRLDFQETRRMRGTPAQRDSPTLLVRTFYQFKSHSEAILTEIRENLIHAGSEWNILGTVLLSTEGCNGTISGCSSDVERFFSVLRDHFPALPYQDSHSDVPPFQRFKVPLKTQIVQARDKDLNPSSNFGNQIT